MIDLIFCEQNKDTSGIDDVSERVGNQVTIKSMETAQSLSLIACLTDLTVSILKDCFFMYRFNKERSMIKRNFPFFFLN